MQPKSPTVFHADHALTTKGWQRDVSITVENGVISGIEKGNAPNADHHYACVLPGMVNVHSHAFQRAMAGLAERPTGGKEDSFWTWRTIMYDAVNRFTPDHLRAIATHLYIELLKSGYTSIGEFHYIHHQRGGVPYANPAATSLAMMEAAHDSGINQTMLPVLYMTSDFGDKAPLPEQECFVHDVEGYLRLVETIQSAITQFAPETGLGVAPHSLRAVPENALREVLATLPALGLGNAPRHIHAAEQMKEVDACIAWSGKRSVQWLLDEIGLDEKWCLIHATHIDEKEQEGICAKGAVAGLCPSTESNLGDGIFPARTMLRDGANFAIGSDSHITANPFAELQWMEYHQRLLHERRSILPTADQLWTRAAKGGAQALGLPTGNLAPDKRADFIALEDSHPLLQGLTGEKMLDAACFGTTLPPVKDVWVRGKRVVHDGHHPRQDFAAESFRQARRILVE